MAQYLHLFETEGEFNSARENDYKEPWVSYTEDVERVDYNKPDPANGYAYVDLGLPSGTLWATMNVGADTVTDYGDYFAWGEIEPNKATAYTWDNYKFGTRNALTKYYYNDDKTTLDPEDDAANVIMGGDWHIPSMAQLVELKENTTSSWTTDYNGTGVAGAVYTSIADISKSIFFPAAGWLSDEGAVLEGDTFSVWVSLRDSYYIGACFLRGNANWDILAEHADRYLGTSVRGVLVPSA